MPQVTPAIARGGAGASMSMQLRGIAGLAVVVGFGMVLISCGGASRPAGVLFVSSQGSSLVDSFGINLNTGVVSQINTGAATGSTPGPMLLDSAGDFAYVLNNGSNNVSQFSVKSNGTLAPISKTAAGTLPMGLALDPAGKFLLVANQGSNDISVFSVGSNAALTPVAGSPFATGTLPTPQAPSTAAPVGITVSSNNFVYVANQGQNSVSAYALNTSSGVLTPIPGSPFVLSVTAPTAALAMETANSVSVLFIGNQGSNNVSAFLINTDGTLTSVSGSPFSAQLGPVAMAVDPTKNFLYVAELNSNQVSQYRINPGNGSLSPLSPAAVSTGTSPVAVAVHPNGLYLYTANVGSDTISAFRITTQYGILTPIQSATTSARPAGLALK